MGDSVRIGKYKNIFSKDYAETWLEEMCVIDSVLKTNPWTYEIKDSKGEKIVRRFNEK